MTSQFGERWWSSIWSSCKERAIMDRYAPKWNSLEKDYRALLIANFNEIHLAVSETRGRVEKTFALCVHFRLYGVQCLNSWLTLSKINSACNTRKCWRLFWTNWSLTLREGHRFQNGSAAHATSYTIVSGAVSLGVKRQGREADHSPPSSAEVKEWVELYLHYPNRTS
jgi:hypothetical protein